MQKTIIIIVAVLAVGFGIYFLVSNSSNNSAPSSYTPNVETNTPASNTPVTSASSNISVSIKNFSFNPSTLAVKPGAKVTWTNNDAVPHTITSDSGSLLNSGALAPGQSFSFTFTDTGSINYHCNFHPSMKGEIIVRK